MNRHRVAIVERADYVKDEEELKEEALKKEFRQDLLFIEAARRQQ